MPKVDKCINGITCESCGMIKMWDTDRYNLQLNMYRVFYDKIRTASLNNKSNGTFFNIKIYSETTTIYFHLNNEEEIEFKYQGWIWDLKRSNLSSYDFKCSC